MDTKIVKKKKKENLKHQAVKVKLSKNTDEINKLKELAKQTNKQTKNNVNIFVCYCNIFNCKRS